MFTHDLDSTASYRTLARGFGSGFARAYRASQRDCAASSAPGRADLGTVRPFGGSRSLDGPLADQRRK